MMRARVHGSDRRSLGFALAILLVALGARPGVGFAQAALRHRVEKGDTIPLLAAEYYGNRKHAIFIMVANKMQHDRPLRPGERLKIPMNREVTVAPGETLENLAETYLGDARRAAFLAEFNKLDADASLAAGTTLQIPVRVTHKAAGKESISNISLAYFATRKQTKLIRDYNFISGQFLEAGQTVIIPLTHVQVRRSRLPAPDKESQKLVSKRHEMSELARKSMQDAHAAWRDGDYAAVKRALTRIDTDYLDQTLAVEVGVLLGRTYVAFSDIDSALATFRMVLERSPKHALSTYDTSPRVRAVWEQAGGAVMEPETP